jgi:hypothetical protein
MKTKQTYLNFIDEEKMGKDCFSRKERKGRQEKRNNRNGAGPLRTWRAWREQT